MIILDIWTECYEWSVIGVKVDDDGLYLATDSGCSCYGPFENGTEFIGPLSFEEIAEEVNSLKEYWNSPYGTVATNEEVNDFLQEIQERKNANS